MSIIYEENQNVPNSWAVCAYKGSTVIYNVTLELGYKKVQKMRTNGLLTNKLAQLNGHYSTSHLAGTSAIPVITNM